MSKVFIPLSKSVRFWPEFLDEVDFLDQIGVHKYESMVNDKALEISGELIYFEELSFSLFGFKNIVFALANQGEYTILPYVAKIKPDFLLSLPDLNLSALIKTNFLIPMENINGTWTKKLEPDSTPKPLALTLGGIGIDVDLKGNLDFNTNNANISLDTIQLGETGIIIEVSDIIPYFSNTNSPPNLPSSFRGVGIESLSVLLPPFWTKTPNQSIDITGKNLLIGTGGFSGTIGLDGDSSGVGHLPGRPSGSVCYL